MHVSCLKSNLINFDKLRVMVEEAISSQAHVGDFRPRATMLLLEALKEEKQVLPTPVCKRCNDYTTTTATTITTTSTFTSTLPAHFHFYFHFFHFFHLPFLLLPVSTSTSHSISFTSTSSSSTSSSSTSTSYTCRSSGGLK